MAGIFGKIFVGIYVEIKRSDGAQLASYTHSPLSIRRVRMRGANVTAHRSWVLASKLLHHVMDVVLKPLRGKCWSIKLTQMVFSVMLLSTVKQTNAGRRAGGGGGPSTCVAVQPKMTFALPPCSGRPVLPYASWLKPLQCYQLHQPARIIQQWAVNHGLMDGCMGPLPS